MAAKAEPTGNEAELYAVVRAARALLVKVEEALPKIDSAITIATVHGCAYDGQTIDGELSTLRSAIDNLDRMHP